MSLELDRKRSEESLLSRLDLGLNAVSPPPGVFSLGVPVDDLFFIGNQLVATSHTGKVGVWNAVTQHWQVRHHMM